jgi:hypothetical protein
MIASSATTAPWEPKDLVLYATDVPSNAPRMLADTPLAPGPCGISKTLLGTSTAWGIGGQLHLGKDQSATYTYGLTADSDIGVGYSTDNSNWSIKGSVHVGNARGSAITMSKSTTRGYFGKKTKTQFQTAKFKYVNCFGQTHWGVKAQKWVAGSQWGLNIPSWSRRTRPPLPRWPVAWPGRSGLLR